MNDDKMQTLILIDGNALLYRSFHGIPELKTKDGALVNAVYGFANSILIAISRFRPKYLAVTFDVGKKTFRNEQYREYKANRTETPEGLIPQFRLAREFCKALNIAIYGKPNYEADDVIGTIVKKVTVHSDITFPLGTRSHPTLTSSKTATRSGDIPRSLKTIIVTGDMDTFQLIDENTNVFSVSRGIKKAEIYDTKKVLEKYGFCPNQMVDYKALRGDPSDNIPGVPGVGEKTATVLLQNFVSLENLYKQILNPKFEILNKSKIKISNKTKELLIQNRDKAFLSKKLATICQEVPMEFNLEDSMIHDYDEKLAKKFLEKLEFRSLIPKLPQSIPNHKQSSLF